jgi:hypothetical protein
MGAWKRETGNRKMEQKELTTYIKESKDTVASLQTTLKGKQATLEKLTSSNTYFDSETGLLLDPDTQARAIILAKQEVENIEAQIELERQRIATWTAKLKPGAKEGATTTEEPKKETSTGFVFTPKATADIKAQYKDFMSRETDMNKRKIAEKYAIDNGYITGS